MNFYISSLIKGLDAMEELAMWINDQPLPGLGVELIAFTHDEEYWNRLRNVLEKLKCPISFHGPYIGVEATSKPGTKEFDWLINSYDKVFSLAKEYEVKHVVFHYTQIGFDENSIKDAQQTSKQNIVTLINLAEQHNVNMLIENIAFPKGKLPLYNNEEYGEIFKSNSKALSIIDIGHAHINKMDIEEFLSKYAKRVQAYHFHNNDGVRDQHNSIMDGSFNYLNFLSLYKKYTPNADIVLEYEPHTNLSKEELLREIEYLSSNI